MRHEHYPAGFTGSTSWLPLRSAFDFVTEPPYSLWLVDQDEGRVTYVSVDLGLVILHGRLSYELDLAVWRESVEAEVVHPYTMVDLVRAADPDRVRLV